MLLKYFFHFFAGRLDECYVAYTAEDRGTTTFGQFQDDKTRSLSQVTTMRMGEWRGAIPMPQMDHGRNDHAPNGSSIEYIAAIVSYGK